MSTVSASTATNSPAVLVAGRYRLVEPLGSGGAGSVYRARDTVLGRDVALKVFRAESTLADDLVRQEREIRMLSTLAHPGLINIFDAGRQNFDGTVRRFLVMELVPDASLDTRLATEKTLPAHEVAALGAQIADALAYIHSRGVIHRDVKPANILIGDARAAGFRRTAKLGDFGIAQFIDGNRLTSDGTILGTAAYLSPEQVSGRSVGVVSDVYSLGLVLLEALTGVQEFPGTVVESAVARVNRDPDVPETLAEEWRTLLSAMTDRDPANRPSAAEVAAILHGAPSPALTGHGRRSAEGRAHRRAAFRTVAQRRRRNALLLVGAIVLGLAACAGSFALGYLLGGR